MSKTTRICVKYAIACLLLPAVAACEAQPAFQNQAPVLSDPQAFAGYWYQGEAELSRYELKQSRYGQSRDGDLVLVYVTEPFLPDRQVKDENNTGISTNVLKLNSIKKFETGIYDYSIMGSTFTPIDYKKYPHTLKYTFSAQDWCGQSFAQLNLRDKKLHWEIRSYFENPGDKQVQMDIAHLEEDVWTRMRLDPQMLPLGEIEMIPAQEFLRLEHVDVQPYEANAILLLQVDDQNNELYVYRITYPQLGRTVEWICENAFPFQIRSWLEKIERKQGRIETTSAVLTSTMKAPYWQLNAEEHEGLRDSLGLKFRYQD